MGNQMAKAIAAAEEVTGENLSDKVLEALDSIESKIDNVSKNEDNSSKNGDDESQEDPRQMSVSDLLDVIDKQNEKIERMVGVMGKMVTQYGAQITDADPTNTSLADTPSEPEIPTLEEITLG